MGSTYLDAASESHDIDKTERERKGGSYKNGSRRQVSERLAPNILYVWINNFISKERL